MSDRMLRIAEVSVPRSGGTQGGFTGGTLGKLGAVGCRLLGRSTPVNADDTHKKINTAFQQQALYRGWG